ncbi:MAG: FliM/FliN family flagellar motor switch protein [Candidatus Gastranaerophilales bacterium]|nr:FliM/FliN family flagellar motor switch protein [Candidatus Gastranaerophilales bacterium]
METKEETIKTSFTSELYSQFSWFKNLFEAPVQAACDEFFSTGFEFKLVGVSENMNVLTQNESFFVTKVQLDAKNDVFVRISQNAIRVILDKVLGKSNKKFDLSSISDLEAKIITTFNEFLYERISDNIDKTKLEKHPDTINLSYFIRNLSSDESARFVLSFPKSVLAPVMLPEIPDEKRINEMIFSDCPVDVTIKVGSTDFAVNDIKKLDVGDIVLFENSNSREMILICDNILQRFAINPNKEIIIPYEEDEESDGGEEDMDTNSLTNLWDSLQIEMSAEFEKIKVSLGELKNIQEGLVVDISSVYNNKVSLKVGEQIVADGELVIINDRYGVKISKVTADDFKDTGNVENMVNAAARAGSSVSVAPNSAGLKQGGGAAPMPEAPAAGGEGGDEFDYSDFDLDE